MTELLRGEPVAADVRAAVEDRIDELAQRGVVPTLGTVLASDDPAQHRFVDLKHDACRRVGIDHDDRRFDPVVDEATLVGAVDDLANDDAVHAIFVQAPLPAHVDDARVCRHVARAKDVDCFHPENLGRLVGGSPRFVPATPAAVRRLLAAYEVPVAGRDVVLVGRSNAIGTPLANLLWGRGEGGNATVTVCHSRTDDLGAKTRRADVLITAAGVPGLVDESMLEPGVVVVDVSANRVSERADGGQIVVGDVVEAAADGVAAARTPVPGGVGPVTLACLLENVVEAASRQCDAADR